MTTATDPTVSLTAAQKDVVEQPSDAWVLVTAGAGAGKTTTLLHRLEFLIAVEELEASEILVLSFSRAAVRELRDRVDRHAVSARRVRAHTFDGWALSLLHQMDPHREDLAGTTFDDRIAMAIEAIDAGVVESFENGPPAHIVIDEVQDLVGIRRELVEALLDRIGLGCGFTMVGDAAQAIYGFQIDDLADRAAETNRFFDWVRVTFGDDLVHVSLDDNFRARTQDARAALPLGPQLQMLPQEGEAARVEGIRIHTALREILETMPDFGSLDDPFVQNSLREFDGTAAILCRTNGQVLWLSERLKNFDIPHRIQRSPRTRPAPAWVAELVKTARGSTMTESQFTEAYGSLPNTVDEPGRVWRSLRRAASSPNNRLDISVLVRAVADGRLPDEVTGTPPHALVLSTVHRAKGLEFDRVVVIEPDAIGDEGVREIDPPAEARELYVAMTRPRDDLYFMTVRKLWEMRKAKRVDRWYIGGRERWMRLGVEASEWDVNRDVPAGYSDGGGEAPMTQVYLRDVVQEGDVVELSRLHDMPMASDQTPPYGIYHDGRAIGEVSERFRRELHRVLQRFPRAEVSSWPQRISGLRVDLIESVAGSDAVAERAGLDVGLWLAPRLSGLGRFDWHGNPDESESTE
ncbi:UvrD-helicase domain-containing protein [Rhodococcus sp. NCIMB 12038]|uniref:UvrD-helicase domain-containing protein n=1 Tax=Rhodococcus sp. NCIMB 12038 TaxID=933800 RepID=UPI000B3C10C6|nr:UvrD-helicase domain-containing protein [Rhodococcus sp. NCIMB 12038]OUS94595.1 DNA helicase [Rhodococcus sp. NCIMB 12038]